MVREPRVVRMEPAKATLAQSQFRRVGDKGSLGRPREIAAARNNPAHRNARQMHLDQRFLHRGLAPPGTFDDSRLERLLAKLQYLQPHFASLGLQLSLVLAGLGVALRCVRNVTHCKPVRLGIQHRVQCLLDTAPDSTVQMVLNPLIVNRDDIAPFGLGVVSAMAPPFLLSWLRLTPTRSARFGAGSPTQLCENNRRNTLRFQIND
jgi:hypothetical protein